MSEQAFQPVPKRSLDDDLTTVDRGEGREAGSDPQQRGPALSSALLQRKIQRRLARRQSGDQGDVAPGAHQALAGAAGSSGAPLPGPLQRKFEGALGVDLGAVRVHTGQASGQAAESISAQAYTVGQDIHFGHGQYDPSSTEGQKLIAHEVAHTVQQAGGPAEGTTQTKLEVSEPGDALEQDADRAAEAMVAGQAASVEAGGGGGAAGVQRFRLPNANDARNVVNQAQSATQQAGDAASNVAQGASQGPGMLALVAIFAHGQPEARAVADLLQQFPGERDAILDYCRQHGGDAFLEAVRQAEQHAGDKATAGKGNTGGPDVLMTPAAPSPVPIPYPNLSLLGQVAGAAAHLGDQAHHGADAARDHLQDGASDLRDKAGAAGKKIRGGLPHASQGTPEPGQRQYDIRGGIVTAVGPPSTVTGTLATIPGKPQVVQEGETTVTTWTEAVVPGSCTTSHGGVVMSGTVQRIERRGPHGLETSVLFISVYFTDPMVIGTVPCIGGTLVDIRGHGLMLTTKEPN